MFSTNEWRDIIKVQVIMLKSRQIKKKNICCRRSDAHSLIVGDRRAKKYLPTAYEGMKGLVDLTNMSELWSRKSRVYCIARARLWINSQKLHYVAVHIHRTNFDARLKICLFLLLPNCNFLTCYQPRCCLANWIMYMTVEQRASSHMDHCTHLYRKRNDTRAIDL